MERHEKIQEHPETPQEKKSDVKIYILFGLIGLVLAASIMQSYQIAGLKEQIKNQPKGTAASGAIDMSGWTENEKMMYEHHGTLPAGSQGNQPAAKSGMVGGC